MIMVKKCAHVIYLWKAKVCEPLWGDSGFIESAGIYQSQAFMTHVFEKVF